MTETRRAISAKAEPRTRRLPAGTLLRRARVGRLATVDERGQPYAVPVCFAFDGRVVFIVIDKKPKRVPARGLRRIRNIEVNPRVALVVDAYREAWRHLWYVLVLGRARVVRPGAAGHAPAIRLLREKYRQYRNMRLDDSPVISIVPRRVISWSGATRRGTTTNRRRRSSPNSTGAATRAALTEPKRP